MKTKSFLSFLILIFFVCVVNAAESTMVFNGTTTNHNGLTISFSTGNFTGSVDGTKMNLYANHPEGNPINGGNDYKDISISTATYVARVTVVWAYNVAGFKLQFLRNNIVVREISGFNTGGNITSATNFSVNEVVDVIRYLDAGVSNSGAFELSQITFDSALPVELISFTANINGLNVELNWQTATEVNNYGFEVQRNNPPLSPLPGGEEKGWVKIGFVNGNGNSNSPKSYFYEDKNISDGKYSYRLKQVDSDGKFEYSKTIEVSFMKPNEFSLEQNYPNPFNPSTKISWQSPVSSHQTLIVYDVLGNEVATLVNEFVEAGNHQIEFNAEGLSSGVYYYKIIAGSFTDTKKLVLMK